LVERPWHDGTVSATLLLVVLLLVVAVAVEEEDEDEDEGSDLMWTIPRHLKE